MALWLVRGGKHGEFEEKFFEDKKIYLTWDHLNLIFPVYMKLMTGFPSFHPEDVGAGQLQRFGFGYCKKKIICNER